MVVAAEVAHRAAVPGARNLAVPAGDSAFIETDVALRLASHNVSFRGKGKRLPLPRSSDGDELWMHRMILTTLACSTGIPACVPDQLEAAFPSRKKNTGTNACAA